jgi:1-phosphatidylinositol phosphodiesterase
VWILQVLAETWGRQTAALFDDPRGERDDAAARPAGPGSSALLARLPAAAPPVSGSTWMSALRDCELLGGFSLPGSHNTMALRDSAWASDTAKCQTLTLSAQLHAGVRFLDIRARHVNDRLVMQHGVVSQRSSFCSVLEDVHRFLADNPSETVIMSLKEEHTPKGNSRSFAHTFADYSRRFPGLFFAPCQDVTAAPRLGEVRGKVVLARRFGVSSTAAESCPADMPRGIPWPRGDNVPEPAATPPFAVGHTFALVQDRYNLGNGMDDEDKRLKVRLFDGARKEAARLPGAIVFNFASGVAYSWLGIPKGIKDLSKHMNECIRLFMMDSSCAEWAIRGRSGIYIMDYVDELTASAVWRAAVDQAREAS